MFATRMTKVDCDPTGKVGFAGATVTARSASLQTPAAVLAAADGDGPEAAGEGAVGDDDAATVADPPPPNIDPIAQRSNATTATSTAATTARRRQYTDAGSGPTGCRSPLMRHTIAPRDSAPFRPCHHHTVTETLTGPTRAWFERNARELPWRTDPDPWGVLVSEVMLAQTPVARVEPVWREWMTRWPTPADLAAATPADALRAWGRLGYPRRALRLHASATAIVTTHGGRVPSTYEDLRALPGVGDYTAGAVISFAYGGRAVVLDVNVRRLLTRVLDGIAAPPGHVTAAERQRAEALLPASGAAEWAIASMELGAVICTARNPRCQDCPLAQQCLWLARGRPGLGQRTTKRQTYQGTDRQARGRIMAALRESETPVSRENLDALWHAPDQLSRALDGLVVDGLVDPVGPYTYALPTGTVQPARG